MSEQLDIVPIRFEIPSDRNAILSSWLRSYWDQKPAELRRVAAPLYFDEHEAAIKRILARDETFVLVVPSPAGDDHVCSWMCGEVRPTELVLHWGASFKFARRQSFFRALVERFLLEQKDRKLVYTHRTHRSRDLAHALGATFNPYRIFT